MSGGEGLRLSITRQPEDASTEEGTYVYRGTATIDGAVVDVVARASAAEAAIELGDTGATPRADVERVVRALVRAATRAEITSGVAPPRRITRWREL